MKSFAPIALFTLAAGVMARDPNCGANYILDQCKTTQTDLINSCATNDWDCLCPAYEAMRTCYNNCPEDPDIPTVEGQVTIFCQNASLYGTKAATTGTASATAAEPSATGTGANAATTATGTDTAATPTATASNNNNNNNNNEGAAAGLARNIGGVLLAVAGAIASML